MSYFLLVNPLTLGPARLTQSAKFVWSLALYAATFIGVLGAAYFGQLTAPLHSPIGWRQIALAAFVAAIVLPYIYDKAQLNRQLPTLPVFCLCIQHGYFWKSIISHISAAS
jgi:hypothetical protein